VPLIGVFVKILKVPSEIMAPIITVICFIGAYSINNDVSGILFVILFGVMGYLMRKFKYDPAPLILAFVLGPLMENSLRQSMMLFRGDVSKVFERPVTIVFLAFALFLFLSPLLGKLLRRGVAAPLSRGEEGGDKAR
jgi:putative tricarboxylic transport membrane protein